MDNSPDRGSSWFFLAQFWRDARQFVSASFPRAFSAPFFPFLHLKAHLSQCPDLVAPRSLFCRKKRRVRKLPEKSTFPFINNVVIASALRPTRKFLPREFFIPMLHHERIDFVKFATFRVGFKVRDLGLNIFKIVQ
jgi:hypothetical protein